MGGSDSLLEALPPLQHLALAYSPAHSHEASLALLALDVRFASIVRNSREPMLAQLRLAWWREQLQSDTAKWPLGEPLLDALRSWRGEHRDLVALVDGWEQLTGEAPLSGDAVEEFACRRGEAFAALARLIAAPDAPTAVRDLGRAWALADLAAHTAHSAERQMARTLAETAAAPRLSRSMRMLAVLHGLARRRLQGHAPSLLATMRLGLFGR